MFHSILEFAPSKRFDIDTDFFINGINLYRGTAMKDVAIKEYVNRVPQKPKDSKRKIVVKKSKFSTVGYISTSLDRQFAESHSIADEASGKIPVLFIINFKRSDGYYLMNNTAYD